MNPKALQATTKLIENVAAAIGVYIEESAEAGVDPGNALGVVVETLSRYSSEIGDGWCKRFTAHNTAAERQTMRDAVSMMVLAFGCRAAEKISPGHPITDQTLLAIREGGFGQGLGAGVSAEELLARVQKGARR